MVIASESYRMSAVGNGVTTTFPCTFRIDDDDEVTVFTLTSAGVLTTLTKTTDYTIDPNQIGDDDGFDIETVSPVANGTAIAAIRNVPLTQSVDLQSQGTISRASLEQALDRLVMMIQQLAEENTRTLKITPAVDVDSDLTQLTPEAGKAIAWNAAGDGLENVDPGDVELATPADNSVTTAKILDAAVTLAKLADLAEARMIGRAAGAGTGVPQALTAAQILTLLAITPDASTVESSGTTLRLKAAGVGASHIAATAISGQTVETAPAVDDLAIISDTSVGANRKMTLQNILTVINLLTADASPDTAADYVMTYDASASTVKKVLLSVLASSVPTSETVAGVIELATAAEVKTGTDAGRALTPANLVNHKSAAKGWCCFEQIGTQSILDDFNVTSITDGGVGITTVTWDTNFSSADYASVASCYGGFCDEDVGSRSTTAVKLTCTTHAGAAFDSDLVNVTAHGDRA